MRPSRRDVLRELATDYDDQFSRVNIGETRDLYTGVLLPWAFHVVHALRGDLARLVVPPSTPVCRPLAMDAECALALVGGAREPSSTFSSSTSSPSSSSTQIKENEEEISVMAHSALRRARTPAEFQETTEYLAHLADAYGVIPGFLEPVVAEHEARVAQKSNEPGAKEGETPEKGETPKEKGETPEKGEGEEETPKEKGETPEKGEGEEETPKEKGETPEEGEGEEETPKEKGETPEKEKDERDEIVPRPGFHFGTGLIGRGRAGDMLVPGPESAVAGDKLGPPRTLARATPRTDWRWKPYSDVRVPENAACAYYAAAGELAFVAAPGEVRIARKGRLVEHYRFRAPQKPGILALALDSEWLVVLSAEQRNVYVCPRSKEREPWVLMGQKQITCVALGAEGEDRLWVGTRNGVVYPHSLESGAREYPVVMSPPPVSVRGIDVAGRMLFSRGIGAYVAARSHGQAGKEVEKKAMEGGSEGKEREIEGNERGADEEREIEGKERVADEERRAIEEEVDVPPRFVLVPGPVCVARWGALRGTVSRRGTVMLQHLNTPGVGRMFSPPHSMRLAGHDYPALSLAPSRTAPDTAFRILYPDGTIAVWTKKYKFNA